MELRDFPKDIKKLLKICEPYKIGCHLENAPKEVTQAYEEVKKWAIKLGQ